MRACASVETQSIDNGGEGRFYSGQWRNRSRSGQCLERERGQAGRPFSLVALSSKHNMSLAFPGPEAPLVAGMEEPLVRRASQGLLGTCETDKSEKPV